jgi:hypothetical protein
MKNCFFNFVQTCDRFLHEDGEERPDRSPEKGVFGDAVMSKVMMTKEWSVPALHGGFHTARSPRQIECSHAVMHAKSCVAVCTSPLKRKNLFWRENHRFSPARISHMSNHKITVFADSDNGRWCNG